jgi:hypothetical protein
MNERSSGYEDRAGAAPPSKIAPARPLDYRPAVPSSSASTEPLAVAGAHILSLYFLGFSLLLVLAGAMAGKFFGGVLCAVACVPACCAAVCGVFAMAGSGGRRGWVVLLVAFAMAGVAALAAWAMPSNDFFAGTH